MIGNPTARLALGYFAMAILTAHFCAYGATVTWQGDVSTNWADGANWDTGSVPGPGDDVVIDGALPNHPTISLASGGVTIKSLTLGQNNTSVLTVAWGDDASKRLIIDGDITIYGNGTLTHSLNGTAENHRLNLEVSGNLVIAPQGKIDANNKGYYGQYGPGATGIKYWGGGSHGGQGAPTNLVYGSVTNPVNIGSGAWGDAQAYGGGAIIIRVRGTATVDGVICADSTIIGSYAGNGSGGSVNILAGWLEGSGVISANASSNAFYGGGGGGRIAIVLTNSDTIGSVTLQAIGGTKPYTYSGGAGTIYVKKASQQYGELRIDNADRATTLSALLTNGVYIFDSIILTNCGRLEVSGSAVLALTNDPAVSSEDINASLVVTSTANLLLPGSWVWSATLTQKGTNWLVVDGDLVLTNSSIFTHDPSTNDLAPNRVRILCAGNMNIASGAMISAAAKGHLVNSGPGRGGSTGDGGGGAHGGQGAVYNNTAGRLTYGSLSSPTTVGSGGARLAGGGRGGGAVELNVGGVLTVNGVVNVQGEAGGGYAGGGAGGSIFITCGGMDGSGVITASGGAAQNNGGAGGGGRIAVVLTNSTTFGGVAIVANGGRAPNGTAAAAGTVYLKSKDKGWGTLVVDNSNQTASVWTLVSTAVTDVVAGDVVLRNKGFLALDTNVSLTVMGSWTNGGSFTGAPSAYVIFAGTNLANICGHTVFSGLICTQGGKKMVFQAGSTTHVSDLSLKGVTNTALVELSSSMAGTWWYLILRPGGQQDVRWIQVQDSHAGGGDMIVAANSTDAGHNTNWYFGAAGTVTWTGAADSNWGNPANWDLGRLPLQIDTNIVIPDVANDPVLDADRTLHGVLTMQAGSAMDLNGKNLTLKKPAFIGGSLVARSSETVTFETNSDFTGGSFVPAGSTVVLAGSGDQAIKPGGNRFWDIKIVQTGGTLVFQDSFAARAIFLTNAATSTRFDGGCQVALLKCTVPATELTFGPGASCLASNLFICGSASSPVKLRSATDGICWRLGVSNAPYARFVDVKDSDATPGQAVYAINCTDSGGNTNWIFSSWLVWNGNTSSNFGSATNWTPAQSPEPASMVLVDGAWPHMPVVTSPVTIKKLVVGPSTNSALTLLAPMVITEEAVLYQNAVITHGDNGVVHAYSLDMTVGADLTVHSGARIVADGLGYDPKYGPGCGQGDGSGGSGGGYGGMGGSYYKPGGMTYGSWLAPTNLGSGGDRGAGGGAVKVTVGGTTLLDGDISADGVLGGTYHGAGSGGSVWLITDFLEGSGRISACGGQGGSPYWSGSGGGGRIAVYVLRGNGHGSVSMTAAGGTNAGDRGAAGTVYVKTATDTCGYVLVDNSNLVSSVLTHLPAYSNPVNAELTQTILIITNRGQVALASDERVRDILVHTNCFLTLSNFFLRVRAKEHHLDNRLLPGPGGTNRTDFYSHIIWEGSGGTVFVLR